MLKKKNREIIKNIKKIMHDMEKRDYDIENIAIEVGGNENKSTPYLYVNSDAIKYHMDENYKDEDESWKYAYLNQLLENVEAQSIILCGAHLQKNSDIYSEKFLNQFEINYKIKDEDEVIIKLHFIFNKLFHDIATIFKKETKTN